ncbi:MAG: carboxypeptidase regulatory-like domain-containing protein [Desulfurococcaceae archaeon]
MAWHLLLLLALATALGQQFEVRVTDLRGTPVQGALVEVVNPSTGSSSSGTTDASGTAILEGLAGQGLYYVRVWLGNRSIPLKGLPRLGDKYVAQVSGGKLNLTLEALALGSIELVDERGKPLAGVRVVARLDGKPIYDGLASDGAVAFSPPALIAGGDVLEVTVEGPGGIGGSAAFTLDNVSTQLIFPLGTPRLGVGYVNATCSGPGVLVRALINIDYGLAVLGRDYRAANATLVVGGAEFAAKVTPEADGVLAVEAFVSGALAGAASITMAFVTSWGVEKVATISLSVNWPTCVTTSGQLTSNATSHGQGLATFTLPATNGMSSLANLLVLAELLTAVAAITVELVLIKRR